MFIEVTAKKPEDAIKQGLEQLGKTIDEVTVEVLDSGGFFRKAKVRLTVDADESEEKVEKTEKVEKVETVKKSEKIEKPVASEKPAKPEKTEKAEKAEKPEKTEKPAKPAKPQKADNPTAKSEKVEKTDKPEKTVSGEDAPAKQRRLRAEDKEALEKSCAFITEVTRLMGFTEGISVAVSGDGETVEITAPERDDSLIIGRHGETLSALSYLAETHVRAEKCHTSVVVDCNGYRARRAASLSAMARRKADECVRRRRKIKLEPMDRTDRRTIHSALNFDGRVTTASEGKEPFRCVVIMPSKGRPEKGEKNRKPVPETVRDNAPNAGEATAEE